MSVERLLHPLARARFARPAIVLAPMEGVHDAGMRALLTELGGFDWVVSEFLRVSQVVPTAERIVALAPELASGGVTPSGVPVDVQLLGGDADNLARTAERVAALGVQAIDLNFGCPAKTVNRHDGGAALLRAPRRIAEVVGTVRQATPARVAVSAKIRLGWEDPDDGPTLAQAAWEAGANWLTVHGRTRLAGYRPPALWRCIGDIARRSPIPIVANGDLFDVAAVHRCQSEANTPHVMLGRGAVADPLLGRKVAAALRRAPPLGPHEGPRWSEWLARYGVLSARWATRHEFLPGRLKQWGMLAARLDKADWVEAAKRLRGADEIVAAVRAWEAARAAGSGTVAVG